VLIAGLVLAAQAQNAPQNPKSAALAKQAEAIQLVRLVNTAEVQYLTDHHVYANWKDLFGSGIIANMQQQYEQQFGGFKLGEDREALPGRNLDILISGDGQKYSLALHDTIQGISVFSDQNGVIYTAEPPSDTTSESFIKEHQAEIQLVRILNTAEVKYAMDRGAGMKDREWVMGNARFATWAELRDSGTLTGAAPMMPVEGEQKRAKETASMNLTGSNEVLPSHTVEILVSPDGKAFSVALLDKSKKQDHYFAVFSDQTGILYLGESL
jgi:hypothetical protein